MIAKITIMDDLETHSKIIEIKDGLNKSMIIWEIEDELYKYRKENNYN